MSDATPAPDHRTPGAGAGAGGGDVIENKCKVLHHYPSDISMGAPDSFVCDTNGNHGEQMWCLFSTGAGCKYTSDTTDQCRCRAAQIDAYRKERPT